MSQLLKPTTFLLIILFGYLLKRCGMFKPRDYRIMQVVVFDCTLPAAILVSFATNPHSVDLLWVTLFGFLAAFVPVPFVYWATRRRPVADRAFLMLNSSGYNIGNFCFPLLQAFYGGGAIVIGAMFDIGNAIMTTAGSNVMTTSLLHVDPNRPLTEQHAGDAPTLPAPPRPATASARRAATLARLRAVALGFLKSGPFDMYMVMTIVVLLDLPIPTLLSDVLTPVANANPFCSMLMVGMLMELPATRDDVRDLLQVVGWRLPFGVLFALAAWFLLPLDATTRQAVALMCFAPTAVFCTLFTDRVIGNAKLAGFTLATTSFIAMFVMTGLHMLMA
ncbi:permease [Bifidobacterium ramosum]|uniref:Permease n=1 Tax=Bifidobacterium ramosum TaxID=1798158 RepID=A0A6L4X0B5_9BIFI|nr:AEC family transporter [Bifidobacterium ramosum]KAB8288088.1 permease [Bifidobacterium ramosum]NEG72692.1 permease [Bifidobacterium ramosum]